MKKKIIRITTISRTIRRLLIKQVDFISDSYDVILVSQNDENGLIEIGKERNIPVYPLPLTRKITPIKDLIALFKLIVLIKKEKPDIIHTHTPKAGLIGMLAAKISGVNHRFHTVAGLPLLESSGIKYKVLVLLERLLYFCASRVYFNSKGLMNIVVERKISNKTEKFKIIGNGSTNGVDTDLFSKEHFPKEYLKQLREENGIKPSDIVYLFIGRMVKDKGVEELVSAFKKLESQYNNIKLVMLGRFEGDLNPVSLDIENEIKGNPNIKFLGYKDDVRPYFAFSDIFVFPSYREGFPNVVMQAGAMGIPSIVSNINGCNEIITDDLNGNIIPVKDTEAVYNAMKNWYNHPDKVLKMANNSRNIIVSRYDQKFVLEKVLEEYNSLF